MAYSEFRPYSVTELSRTSGVPRFTIYEEILRGCLVTCGTSGGSWGHDTSPAISQTEAARWRAAWQAERQDRRYRRRDHALHHITPDKNL